MAAESVGLAASVGGLVSLGLQIAGGILKYVDAFESRQDDLEFVRTNSEALKATLRVIETWANSPGQGPEAIAAATRSMQLFEMELCNVKALHDELADLDGPDWTSRLANKKKKLTYAFSRPKIQDLGQRLQKATNALQLTLNGLGLQTLRHHTDRMVAVETSSQAVASQTVLIRSEIAAVQMPMAIMNDRLHSLQGGVNAATQLLVSQYELLSDQIGESNDNGHETKDLMQQMIRLQLKQEEETNKRHQELAERFAGFIDQVQQSYQPSLTRKAASCKLAGEPAFLKEMNDAIRPLQQFSGQTTTPDMPVHASHISPGPPFSLRGHDSVTWRACTCPRLQNVKERRRFGLEWETTSHWPDCSMAGTNTKKQVTLNFRYNTISRILKKAIHASFAWTCGAGGFSISPSFNCNPTVDISCDPAFRIMALLYHGLEDYQSSARELETFAIGCMRKLAKLLNSGKAYPTAVTIYNESLMHRAVDNFYVAQMNRPYYDAESNLANILIELIQMLLSYGVAAFTYDTLECSPLARVQPFILEQEPVQALVNILMQADSESRLAFSDVSTMYNTMGWVRLTVGVRRQYRVSSDFAEAFGCGLLSLAVINNDVEEVHRILHCAPGTITEKDKYGQTPLHLAALWSNPDILEVLLQSADQNDGLLRQRDTGGLTAFEAAILHSSESCTCNTDDIDGECTSCSSIDLWIDTECGIRMHNLAQSDHAPKLWRILSTASQAARHKYVSLMKKRWNSIRRNAQSSSHTSPSCCGLKVVCKSTAVQRRSTLWTQHDECQPTSEISEDMGWIFNEISDSKLAELFYCHGFQPTRSCLTDLRGSYELGYREHEMNPAYLDWLVSHGVDLGFRSSSGPPLLEDSTTVGLVGAHFAFFFMCLDLNADQKYNLVLESLVPWTTSNVDLLATNLRRNFTDGCSCYCTEEGCSPFTWMMKGEISMRKKYSRQQRRAGEYANALASHYSRCGSEMTMLTYKSAIRYATFIGLNLSHTCCDAEAICVFGDDWAERDDVDIINDEQNTLLEKLEELIMEFEDKAFEFLDTELNEQCSFSQFWPTYWLRRMGEEVDKLEGADLSEAEREVDRKAAEEIGVRLVDNREDTKRVNPYDREIDLRYWLYELDQISPEYNEPWPEAGHRVSELP